MPIARRTLTSHRLGCVVGCLAIAAVLAGCTSTLRKMFPSSTAPSSSRYYKDDGPGETASPVPLGTIPDAVPRTEALHRGANRPYSVFGRDYVPATSLRPYRERGTASWYGRKFHGAKTSIGDTYDMYAMTAAHPTLPLPSYARVTSLASGKSVVVRVNDRGPFLHNRLIDLSYAAAHRIGIAQGGSGEVEVEAILPHEIPINAAKPLPPVVASVTPVAPSLPVEPVVPARGASGFAVQLGAFSNQANAGNFLEHVQNQVATEGVEPKIRQANGLYKVYIGPFAQREEAQRIAVQLETAFGFTTTLAPH